MLFTTLDILLGIPNYDKNNDVANLNFIILFAKNYIYTCKKNSIPIDFYKFQVNLKTRMIIEAFRSNMYNKSLEFQQKWSVLADSIGWTFYFVHIITSRPFLKTAGGIVLGSVAVSAVSAVSADVLPYISVAIKASFLKLGMCNICKNNIAKMFLDFFKILNCSLDRGFLNFW